MVNASIEMATLVRYVDLPEEQIAQLPLEKLETQHSSPRRYVSESFQVYTLKGTEASGFARVQNRSFQPYLSADDAATMNLWLQGHQALVKA